MDVCEVKRVSEVRRIHIELFRVDIIGKRDAPSLAFKRVAHQSDAGEKFRDGSLRYARTRIRPWVSRNRVDTLLRITIEISFPESRYVPAAFEQDAGIG